MLKKLRRERERPIKAIALIGAVWLVTLSGVAAYAEKAPTPANAEAAAYDRWVPLDVMGSRT
jgi:hypothetical protein